MKRILLAILFAFSCRAAAAEKPNIILILADDLGWGDLGCYGQKNIQTPHLDKLAAEGMKFTQFYAGSTVCAPSRCALMTGRHTGHATIRGNADLPLHENDRTMGAILKEGGYASAVIGKWGLGDPGTTGVPTRKGFDYFFGYLNQVHAHNYYPEYLYRGEERVTLKNKVTPPANKRAAENGAGIAHERIDYSHDLMAADALKWIREKRETPFFLYLAFTLPHANNEAGQKGMEVPDFGPYANKDWPDPEKGRAAMITRMDADIGRLMALLKELGIDERTLVLFSSDNGPHKEGGANPEFHKDSGPYRGIKRDLYDGGIRVPLICRWPGKIAAGKESNHLSANWDLLSTFCEFAGLKAPQDLDGVSIARTLLGQQGQRQHAHLYWEFYEKGAAQAVRTAEWKGIWFRKQDRFELYSSADVAEAKDLASEKPEVVSQLCKIITAAHAPSANPAWNP